MEKVCFLGGIWYDGFRARIMGDGVSGAKARHAIPGYGQRRGRDRKRLERFTLRDLREALSDDEEEDWRNGETNGGTSPDNRREGAGDPLAEPRARSNPAMTSPKASMVSSGAARGSMDATPNPGTTQSPRMPKASAWGKPLRLHADRPQRPDAAFRQSRSREHAGSAAAAWTGTTQNNSGRAVRGEG
jgi:hypothetical protein